MPTNKALMATELERAGPQSRALILKWNRLHSVRTGLGCLAIFAFLIARRTTLTTARCCNLWDKTPFFGRQNSRRSIPSRERNLNFAVPAKPCTRITPVKADLLSINLLFRRRIVSG
jgi:hypothetical protein